MIVIPSQITLSISFIAAILMATHSTAAQILQNDPFEQPELIPLPLELSGRK